MLSKGIKNILGERVIVRLKSGGQFFLKVTEAANVNGREWIRGFDDEMENIQIDLSDIAGIYKKLY